MNPHQDQAVLAGVGQLYMLSHGKHFSFDNTRLTLMITIGNREYQDLGEYSNYWMRAGQRPQPKRDTAILKAGSDFYVFINFRGRASNKFKGQDVGGAFALFKPNGDILESNAFSWIVEDDMITMFGDDWIKQKATDQLKQMSKYRLLLALKNQGYNGIQSQLKKIRHRENTDSKRVVREKASNEIKSLFKSRAVREAILNRYAYRLFTLIEKDDKFLELLDREFGDVRAVRQFVDRIW